MTWFNTVWRNLPKRVLSISFALSAPLILAGLLYLFGPGPNVTMIILPMTPQDRHDAGSCGLYEFHLSSEGTADQIDVETEGQLKIIDQKFIELDKAKLQNVGTIPFSMFEIDPYSCKMGGTSNHLNAETSIDPSSYGVRIRETSPPKTLNLVGYLSFRMNSDQIPSLEFAEATYRYNLFGFPIEKSIRELPPDPRNHFFHIVGRHEPKSYEFSISAPTSSAPPSPDPHP